MKVEFEKVAISAAKIEFSGTEAFVGISECESMEVGSIYRWPGETVQIRLVSAHNGRAILEITQVAGR